MSNTFIQFTLPETNKSTCQEAVVQEETIVFKNHLFSGAKMFFFQGGYIYISTGVSENSGFPQTSILIGFSIINHPLWGTPIFGNIQVHICPSNLTFQMLAQ